jgi:hypothetical protein
LNNKALHSIKFGSDKLFFITLAIVSISFIDFSLVGTIYGTIFTDKVYGVMLFTVLSLACIFSQILFMAYAKVLVRFESQKNRLIYWSSWFFALGVESLVIGILLAITIQIITTSQYTTLLISTLVTASQISTLGFIGLLLSKLIRWTRSNPDLTVVVFIIAMILLAVNVSSMTILHVVTSASAPKIIDSHGCGLTCVSQRPILALIYSVSYSLSYIAIWISSIVLLRNFQDKIKRTRLWILILLPITLFLLSINSSLLDNIINLFGLDFLVEDAIYTILVNVTGPLAGVVSGLVFWYMARNLYHSRMRSHIILVSYGIIILLSLNYSTGFQLFLFPPYGTISTSFMMVGSFAIFVGVYFSSIYVAQDSKLRAFIANPKSPVYKELKFFSSTGTSENRESTISNVTHVLKNIAADMEDESGVPLDLDDNLMEYVKLVLEEKKIRKKSTE